jgi:hypothetical protein
VVGRVVALLGILLLSGCASINASPTSVPVVPVEAVIDSLKCGFARAIDYDVRRRSGLFGATAKVALDVNLIEGVDASGNISVGVPIFSGVGSFTPSLSLTHSEVRTINSSVDFEIDLRPAGTSVCQLAGGRVGQDSGFSNWIGAVVVGINNAVAGPPKARMIQYVYESDFTVKTGGTLGAKVELFPVKLDSSMGSSRSDIQHMKITVDAVTVVAGKVRKGGSPFFVPASLSGKERRGTFNLPTQ